MTARIAWGDGEGTSACTTHLCEVNTVIHIYLLEPLILVPIIIYRKRPWHNMQQKAAQNGDCTKGMINTVKYTAKVKR